MTVTGVTLPANRPITHATRQARSLLPVGAMSIVKLALAALLIAGCTTSGRDPIRHVFATSGDYDGNLPAWAGDSTLDGPAAADLLCNRAAADAHLGGTWTAWISVGDGSNLDDPNAPSDLKTYPHATYRLAAIDRIVGDGPWYSRGLTSDGMSESVMFADRHALATGQTHDIFYDETGRIPQGQTGATTWTGTRTDGTPTSWDCSGWTDNTAASLGVGGAEYQSNDWIDIGPTWTDDANLSCDFSESHCPSVPVTNRDAYGWGTMPCNTFAKLYCFEDAPS